MAQVCLAAIGSCPSMPPPTSPPWCRPWFPGGSRSDQGDIPQHGLQRMRMRTPQQSHLAASDCDALDITPVCACRGSVIRVRGMHGEHIRSLPGTQARSAGCRMAECRVAGCQTPSSREVGAPGAENVASGTQRSQHGPIDPLPPRRAARRQAGRAWRLQLPRPPSHLVTILWHNAPLRPRLSAVRPPPRCSPQPCTYLPSAIDDDGGHAGKDQLRDGQQEEARRGEDGGSVVNFLCKSAVSTSPWRAGRSRVQGGCVVSVGTPGGAHWLVD